MLKLNQPERITSQRPISETPSRPASTPSQSTKNRLEVVGDGFAFIWPSQQYGTFTAPNGQKYTYLPLEPEPLQPRSAAVAAAAVPHPQDIIRSTPMVRPPRIALNVRTSVQPDEHQPLPFEFAASPQSTADRHRVPSNPLDGNSSPTMSIGPMLGPQGILNYTLSAGHAFAEPSAPAHTPRGEHPIKPLEAGRMPGIDELFSYTPPGSPVHTASYGQSYGDHSLNSEHEAQPQMADGTSYFSSGGLSQNIARVNHPDSDNTSVAKYQDIHPDSSEYEDEAQEDQENQGGQSDDDLKVEEEETNTSKPPSRRKSNKKHRHFTNEENRELLERWLQGQSYAQIDEEVGLGHPRRACMQRLWYLKRRDEIGSWDDGTRWVRVHLMQKYEVRVLDTKFIVRLPPVSHP